MKKVHFAYKDCLQLMIYRRVYYSCEDWQGTLCPVHKDCLWLVILCAAVFGPRKAWHREAYQQLIWSLTFFVGVTDLANYKAPPLRHIGWKSVQPSALRSLRVFCWAWGVHYNGWLGFVTYRLMSIRVFATLIKGQRGPSHNFEASSNLLTEGHG